MGCSCVDGLPRSQLSHRYDKTAHRDVRPGCEAGAHRAGPLPHIPGRCAVGQLTATRLWMETIMQALQTLVQDGTLAGEWVLDPGRSSVRLKTRAFGLPVKGLLSEVGGYGTVSADGEVSGTIAVAVASIDTGNSKRDTHLRSAEIFDSGDHPHITFTVDGIRPSGQGVAVTGTLTVRDRTLPLSFDA